MNSCTGSSLRRTLVRKSLLEDRTVVLRDGFLVPYLSTPDVVCDEGKEGYFEKSGSTRVIVINYLSFKD